MKITNNYITHKRVIDGELERKLDFVNYKVYELQNLISPWNEGFVTKHRRMQAKAQRRSDKVNLMKNLTCQYYGWNFQEKYPLTYKKTKNWW